MKSFPNRIVHQRVHATRQRGVVLFFALIALVVMSLAAVALIRSVDTSTMIAGNLAFKQSATSSGDSGVEAAIGVLAADQAAMIAQGNNVLMNTANTFNVDNPNNGYYSNSDPSVILTDNAVWDAIDQGQVPEIVDQTGNHIRYVIQRMCRNPNQLLRTDNCLFSAAVLDKDDQRVKLPSDVCNGSGCPAQGQSPEYRITSRTIGPGNTVSYVQAIVF